MPILAKVGGTSENVPQIPGFDKHCLEWVKFSRKNTHQIAVGFPYAEKRDLAAAVKNRPYLWINGRNLWKTDLNCGKQQLS